MRDYLVPSPEQEFPSQSWKKKITIDLTLRHDQADQPAALTNIHNTSKMSHVLEKIQYLMHIQRNSKDVHGECGSPPPSISHSLLTMNSPAPPGSRRAALISEELCLLPIQSNQHPKSREDKRNSIIAMLFSR